MIEWRGLKQSDGALANGCNQGRLSYLMRAEQAPTHPGTTSKLAPT